MKGHIEELLLGGRPMTELEIKQKQEIERLNNIIKGIEKYCIDEIEAGNKALEKLSNLYNSSDNESFIKGQQAKCEHILDKIQELRSISKRNREKERRNKKFK